MKDLLAEIQDLKSRLQEAEATIDSIRSGEVDALVVSRAEGEELYMLHGAERPYRILVESMNEGALSLTPEGVIIYANNAFIMMAGGSSSGSLLGRSFREMVAARDARKFDALWAKALEEKGATELEMDFDGRVVPVYLSYGAQLIDQEPTVFLVVADITEQKKAQESISRLNEELRHEAEELERRVAERTRELKAVNVDLAAEVFERRAAQRALQEERERLAITLQSIGDGVIATDADSKVVLLNGVAEHLTGWSQEEAVGKPLPEVFNIINEETRKRAEDIVEKAISEGVITGLANHTILIARDGRETLIADSCAPILSEEGIIFGAVLVFRDVTDELEAERLRASLNEINASINSSLEFEAIMEAVVRQSCSAVDCDSVSFEMKHENYWRAEYAEGLPRDLTGVHLTGEDAPDLDLIARTREPLIFSQGDGGSPIFARALEAFNAGSIMLIPVNIKNGVEAAIRFVRSPGKKAFDEIHLDFARKLAVSLSLALQNARLYAAERNIAQTLQEALIITPSQLQGVEFSHLYRSATESARVGGDFYNIFEVGAGKIWVLIGDVAGKGVSAATLTLQVQNTIKSFAKQGYSPAEVIGKTNKVIVRASKANDFVTVFLCSIDIKTGDLVYCSGGHPPAIIKRKSGEIETLATSSPILGAFSDLEYSEERTVVERGDMLVLYTDGVIETRNTEGALVGIQRLTEIVAAPVSLPKMPQHIFKAISNFSGGKMNDDVALLIVSLADQNNG